MAPKPPAQSTQWRQKLKELRPEKWEAHLRKERERDRERRKKIQNEIKKDEKLLAEARENARLRKQKSRAKQRQGNLREPLQGVRMESFKEEPCTDAESRPGSSLSLFDIQKEDSITQDIFTMPFNEVLIKEERQSDSDELDSSFSVCDMKNEDSDVQDSSIVENSENQMLSRGKCIMQQAIQLLETSKEIHNTEPQTYQKVKVSHGALIVPKVGQCSVDVQGQETNNEENQGTRNEQNKGLEIGNKKDMVNVVTVEKDNGIKLEVQCDSDREMQDVLLTEKEIGNTVMKDTENTVGTPEGENADNYRQHFKNKNDLSSYAEHIKSSGSEFVPLESGSTDSEESRLSTSQPLRGRKRKHPNQSRKDRKMRLDNNEKHFNSRGEEVLPKVFNAEFHCSCKRRCTYVVPVEERRRAFYQFWKAGSFSGRCGVINLHVTETKKKRTYTKNKNSKRSKSRKYFFGETQVCKTAFLKSLKITQNRVTVALKKKNMNYISDLRGTKSGGKNKHSKEKVEEVVKHIDSFPKYISHYCQTETDAKFLNGDLNLNKMYEMYKMEHNDAVSLSSYKSIFYSRFKLPFNSPKKDP